MILLTRPEEYVMLAVWKLQGEAYTLSIRKKLCSDTGYEWSLSSIYTPLNRLAKKRLLSSQITEPISKRGGRHKRVYQLTPEGKKALLAIRTVEESVWSGVFGLQPMGLTK